MSGSIRILRTADVPRFAHKPGHRPRSNPGETSLPPDTPWQMRARLPNPLLCFLACRTLRWYHDHFRGGSVRDRIIRHDFHAPAGVNRSGGLSTRVKLKRRVGTAGNVNVLEHLPGSGEIDHYRAFRDQECDWNASSGRRSERTHHWRGRAFLSIILRPSSE